LLYLGLCEVLVRIENVEDPVLADDLIRRSRLVVVGEENLKRQHFYHFRFEYSVG